MYVVPDSAAKATLVASADFGGRTAGVIRVQAFADDKCAKTPHGNRMAAFISTGALAPLSGIAIPVEANKELVFTFAYEVGVPTMTFTSSCIVTTAFRPEQGKTYRAHIALGGGSCTVRLSHSAPGAALGPADPIVADARPVKPQCYNIIDG
jgi:hypothetical protein